MGWLKRVVRSVFNNPVISEFQRIINDANNWLGARVSDVIEDLKRAAEKLAEQ